MRTLVVVGVVWAVFASVAAVGAAQPDGQDLLKALKSGDEAARLAAIDALAERGAKVKGAVRALAGQLRDDSPAIRAHAAHALGQIGSRAKRAAGPLAKLVFDKDPVVRREAINAYRLIRPGPEVSIPLFTKLFEEADPELRIHVMSAMAEQGKEAVPPLTKALANEKATYWACLVLAEIGPDAQEAVPALVEVLNTDERPEVRREAAIAIAAVGPGAASAVPALANAMEEDRELMGGPAAYALGAIGTKAKAAAEKVARLADDPKSPPFLRTVCLWALARMNPDDQQLVRKVVPRLVDALKSPQPRLRAAAARALIDLDPDPEIARPLIKKAMEEASPEVLDDILDAVAALGEKAVPRLIVALEAKQVRAEAAAIIARIGPKAKAAVPALAKALADDNPETRNEVLFALAAIGPAAKSALPQIADALGDSEAAVRYGACYALGRIGPAAKSAEAKLQANLTGEDESLAMVSAWALARINPDSPQTAKNSVPVLIMALAELDVSTRVQAADSLRRLGPLAKDAAAALKKAQEDEDRAVRSAAAKALEAIGQ